MPSAYDAIYRNTKHVMEYVASPESNPYASEFFYELDTSDPSPEMPGNRRSYLILPFGSAEYMGVTDNTAAVSQNNIFIDVFYPSVDLNNNQIHQMVYEDRKTLVKELNDDENYTGAIDMDTNVASASEDVGILGRFVVSSEISTDPEFKLFTLRLNVRVEIVEEY